MNDKEQQYVPWETRNRRDARRSDGPQNHTLWEVECDEWTTVRSVVTRRRWVEPQLVMGREGRQATLATKGQSVDKNCKEEVRTAVMLARLFPAFPRGAGVAASHEPHAAESEDAPPQTGNGTGAKVTGRTEPHDRGTSCGHKTGVPTPQTHMPWPSEAQPAPALG